MKTSRTNVVPVVEALFVTFLWSTSYILIKIGLEEINPWAFAAYRYTIASVALAFFVLYKKRIRLKNFITRKWSIFLVLGFTGYFIAQGLQYLGLYYLPPLTVTFILNLTPIFVLVFSVMFLNEKPTIIQLVGILLTLIGVSLFFYHGLQGLDEISGIFLTLVSGIGWAAYMILSRYSIRDDKEDVVVLTTCSMVLGALMLNATTILTGNVIEVSFNSWLIILWLAIVNTSLAFVFWNHALKNLKVYEQSILQNTMLIQITLLSYVFFNEQLTPQKILGLVMVLVGVLIVQLRFQRT